MSKYPRNFVVLIITDNYLFKKVLLEKKKRINRIMHETQQVVLSRYTNA